MTSINPNGGFFGLYRNSFSKKQSNVDELNDIIAEKVKGGNTLKNITWDELDGALSDLACPLNCGATAFLCPKPNGFVLLAQQLRKQPMKQKV